MMYYCDHALAEGCLCMDRVMYRLDLHLDHLHHVCPQVGIDLLDSGLNLIQTFLDGLGFLSQKVGLRHVLADKDVVTLNT